MKAVRLAAAVLAATVAVLAFAAPANAATVVQPFSADSGDACPYGVTAGTITWNIGPSPLPTTGVAVNGRLLDRPLLFADPGATCPDDGYRSTAIFIAYSGGGEAVRKTVAADNGVVAFDFTLTGFTTARGIEVIVVQVCRDAVRVPLRSYCGTPVRYPSPLLG
jgi:hypothetical protein